jgi:signal transduction histidine kinase
MAPKLPDAVRREAEENILIMEDGVSRLRHVAEVLLAADRIQEGSLPMERERVSLKAVIEETVQGMASQLKKRGQRMEMQELSDVSLTLDRRLLSGVLRELLDNAAIYSPEGGTIQIRAHRSDRHVEVSVEDRGVGIPPEDLPRIFERFCRGSNAGRYDPNGTGIGLYITKGIVERFGGRISVQSTEGKGTTVTFTLPVG